MKVWVVTRDEHSYEGLEGAFDVYEGVFATPEAALAWIAPPGVEYPRPVRFDLNPETGRVTRYDTCQRCDWRNGTRVVTGTYESRQEEWTIREVEL